MSKFWDETENITRDLLLCATSLIKDPDRAGYVFGIGLVITDHLLRPLKWFIR